MRRNGAPQAASQAVPEDAEPREEAPRRTAAGARSRPPAPGARRAGARGARCLPGRRALVRLQRGARRTPRQERGRGGCLPRSGRLRPARRADRGTQRAGRRASVPGRPRRLGARAAAHPRLRPRWRCRPRARVARRAGARHDRLDDPRRAADARRPVAADRGEPRRDPATHGSRRQAGAASRAPRRAARAAYPGRAAPADPRPDLRLGLPRPAPRALHPGGGRGRAPARARGRGARDAGAAVRAARPGDRRLQAPGPRAPARVEARLGLERGGEPAGRGGARHVPRAFRRRGDRDRADLRAPRHTLRAAARPRHEGRQGREPEGRPVLRARHDRDPHPRADPRQAGGRRRGPEPEPEPRHPRRHLRRPAAVGEPARRVARQGHLGRRRVGGPRSHAAHPDRRHDRLGQVGLHQHDPHLDPVAVDARRGAPDPDRPQAHRAQLLRVDPASPHAGRLEPEGSKRCPAQRRHRDGTALRAALAGARAQLARGQPCLPQARRGGAAVPVDRDR